MNNSNMIDRRVIISDEKKTVSVVNYKAGYSTFNNLLALREDIPTRHGSKKNPFEGVNGYRKTLFLRSPYARFASYLNDKVILKRGQTDVVRRNLIKAGGKSLISRFEEIGPHSGNDISAFVDDYVEFLSPVLHLDGHTAPQSILYTRHGLNLSDFDEIFTTEDNTSYLEREFGIVGEPTNRTKSSDMKDLVLTDKVRSFCQVWYSVDLKHWAETFG